MISPSDIKAKAERKYPSYLQAIVQNIPFSKIIIPGDKAYSKTSIEVFEKEISALVNNSKEKKGFGYALDFQTITTKTIIGTQSIPTSIYFETEKDFLKYLGREGSRNFYC